MMKKKLIAFALAFLVILNLVPGSMAANNEDDANVTNEMSYTHAYIVKGSTLDVQMRFYSGNRSGGYESLLFKTALDGDETQEELNALGSKLVKKGTKPVESYGGWHYSVPIDKHIITSVETSDLSTGTYLLAGCVLLKSGDEYKAAAETVCAIAIHVVAEEKPITSVEYYLCEEDGTVIRQLKADENLEVHHYYDHQEGKRTYIKVQTYPDNATEYCSSLESSWADDNDENVYNMCYGSALGNSFFRLSASHCGSGTVIACLSSFATGEDPMYQDAFTAHVPCSPDEYRRTIRKATCTEDGLLAYPCFAYNETCTTVFDGEILPATGHTLRKIDEIVAHPTATKPGIARGICQTCRSKNAEASIPAIFTDVAPDAFYSDALDHGYALGWVTGLTADTFGPTATCNRAQVVTFLWRAVGSPEPASTSHSFTDVTPGSFYEKPVLWAVENGITTGISATAFSPTGVCNRAQVVTFLWRAAGSPEPTSASNPFTDVKATDFFYKPVLWAIENGITNGLSATEFGPTAPCNRAQVVTFLYRAYN